MKVSSSSYSAVFTLSTMSVLFLGFKTTVVQAQTLGLYIFEEGGDVICRITGKLTGKEGLGFEGTSAARNSRQLLANAAFVSLDTISGDNNRYASPTFTSFDWNDIRVDTSQTLQIVGDRTTGPSMYLGFGDGTAVSLEKDLPLDTFVSSEVIFEATTLAALGIRGGVTSTATFDGGNGSGQQTLLISTTEPPTLAPTIVQSLEPTTSVMPTVSSSLMPSMVDSLSPTTESTFAPTVEDSTMPSVVSSAMPSLAPSDEPSVVGSFSPTVEDSTMPSVVSSALPSLAPSDEPSVVSSTLPSSMPSTMPSFFPTDIPELCHAIYACDPLGLKSSGFIMSRNTRFAGCRTICAKNALVRLLRRKGWVCGDICLVQSP